MVHYNLLSEELAPNTNLVYNKEVERLIIYSIGQFLVLSLCGGVVL